MNYVDELLNGKLIRITYNTFFEDFTADGSGWSEELWSYEENLDMFKLLYPVSSYEDGFFTLHTLDEAEINLKNIETDKYVKCIKIENKIADNIDVRDLKTFAFGIFDKLDEKNLRIFINQFYY